MSERERRRWSQKEKCQSSSFAVSEVLEMFLVTISVRFLRLLFFGGYVFLFLEQATREFRTEERYSFLGLVWVQWLLRCCILKIPWFKLESPSVLYNIVFIKITILFEFITFRYYSVRILSIYITKHLFENNFFTSFIIIIIKESKKTSQYKIYYGIWTYNLNFGSNVCSFS